MNDAMNSSPDLLSQISELQQAVLEMKGTLTEAVSRLSTVSEEPQVVRELLGARQNCDTNTAHVLKLLLTLKGDITSLKKEMSTVSDRQGFLQVALWQVLEERRLLLADLSSAGVISPQTRSKLECGLILPDSSLLPTGRRSASGGSGSHSNDSGVALLLEKASQVFGTDLAEATPPSGHHRPADQDSLPEQPSLLVPPSVYDYVAALSTAGNQSTLSAHSSHSAPPTTHPEVAGSICAQGEQEDDGALLYDSDSSLTVAANKSISLSASLSREMRVTPSVAPTRTASRESASSLGRTGSDGSDQSQEYSRKHRRNSPEGIGSSETYGRARAGGKREYYQHHHHHHGHRHHRDPSENQRYKVAKELLDTEKKYCKTLWTIQDTFAEPLRKAGILSHTDITTLFPDEVYQLYEKHCLLQHQLRERLASWKWHPLVGDILSRFTDPHHSDILRLYTAYVNDFPEVLKTFHRLCQTCPSFTKFIKSSLERPSCGGLDLGAFLLTPVQRIPRYILILKHLLKYTDHMHPDYRHIHSCLDRLREFLSRLNDSMEHSFQLVHTTLLLSAPASLVPTSASSRTSEHQRRSSSSAESPPLTPNYSPGNLSNDSPQSSQTSSESERHRSVGSPQRSLSTAGRSSPRAAYQEAHRSSSLPRESVSSTESRLSVSGFQEATPRIRSRSEGVASRRPLATRSHCKSLASSPDDSSLSRSLVAARSVADVVQAISPEHKPQAWEELTASEPSLLEAVKQTRVKQDPQHILPSSRNTLKVSKIHSQAWAEVNSPSSDDTRQKKKSIRHSLKNMFSFKKSRPTRSLSVHNQHFHPHLHQHSLYPPHRPQAPPPRGSPLLFMTPIRGTSRNFDQDEGDYWETSGAPESISSAPPTTTYGVLNPQAPPPPHPPLSVGDFVDEDGNPCSNV